MSVDITHYLKTYKQSIDQALSAVISKLEASEQLKKAMLYSIQAGGKRIRPILLLATLEALEASVDNGYATAVALELIHTYSLIHDDLPTMDDDALRRGMPTNHIVFGEATAVLAGDALLTYAFEVLVGKQPEQVKNSIPQLVYMLAKASGPEGMVGGQQDDLLAEGKQLTLQEMESIHLRKTGKLLSFAVEAGALLGGASPHQQEHLSQFAYHLGIAFQIRDDILDIEGNEEMIGKPVGSDFENDKNTYPRVLTLQGAKDHLDAHIEQAYSYLHRSECKTQVLEGLTNYILKREV